VKTSNRLKRYFSQQLALRFYNFRLYIVGQFLSVTGTRIQSIAMIWLAYRLTNSPFMLGLIVFCEQIPIFVLAPFAGVFADHWNKQKALVGIELLALLQAATLGTLTLTNHIEVWHLVVLSLLLGTINSFEVPIRQSFVVDMVDRNKNALSNAIAFNSTIFNLSRIIGPSLAGILIGAIGEGWCFVINAGSYTFVALSILLMRVQHKEYVPISRKKILTELKVGVSYIYRQDVMWYLLIILMIVSFTRSSFRALSPVFAKEILAGGAEIFGFLISSAGVGAILGAIFLTNGFSDKMLRKIVSYTGLILASSLIFIGFTHWLWLALIFMALGGLSQMVHTTSTNTLLQLYTDDDKRGRVMSFYTVCLQGTTPFGGLVAGSLASLLGVSWAYVLMGAMGFVGILLLRRKIK